MSTDSGAKSYYRPDIQGLRGIAVLLVVIYHTEFALPGGFIGVDMFFVISGFVITQVLLREYESTGTIRLKDFYARRARRLIPALGFVLMFTLAVSVIVMSPFSDQKQIIKSTVASVFFAGNFHLFAINSYDALVNNPLRHLWSLGVEEQFYWVYPVLFLGLVRGSKLAQHVKRLAICLSLIAVVSYVVGVVLTFGFDFGYHNASFLGSRFGFLWKIGFLPGNDWPAKFAFFGSPARFWEILVGSLLAVLAKRPRSFSPRVNQLFVVFGGVCILWSALMLSSAIDFPGFVAVVPVLGTASLIWFGTKVSVLNRLLSSQKLRFIGDISYSWYLWHWPFIVFARVIWPGVALAPLIAAGLSMIPATFSYKHVESVLRIKPIIQSRRRIILICSLSLAPLLVSGVLWQAADTGLGLPGLGIRDNFASQNGCGNAQDPDYEFVLCTFGSVSPNFTAVLYGDSTARSISDGVIDAVNKLGGSLTIATSGGCQFYVGEFDEGASCNDLNYRRLEYLRNFTPDILILNNRQIFEGCKFKSVSLAEIFGLRNANLEFSETSNRYYKAISATLGAINEMGIVLINVEQVPWCGPAEPSLLRRQPESLSDAHIDNRRSRAFLDSLRLKILSFPHNQVVRSEDYLCKQGICNYFVDDQPVFADPTHLTSKGSRLLTPGLVRAINNALGN